MKKMFLLVATLLLLSAALLTGCQSSSINLMDYVTVTFSGLDGQGSASCTLDTVALEKELLGDKAGQLTQETAEKMATIAQFEASLTLAPDRQDTLSNGDTVTVTVTGNGTLAQQLGLSGLDSTKSFSVEGLQEPIEVDAFDSAFFNTDDGVRLVFEGASPNASLSIVNTCQQEPASLITYTAEPNQHLSNGDTVTITASLPSYVTAKGYTLKHTETTLTIDNLDTQFTDFAQLSEGDQKAARQQWRDFFDTTFENRILFYLAGGGTVDLVQRADVTCDNLTFPSDVIAVPDQGVTLIPFTVDVNGRFDWWDHMYYSSKIEKSFPDAAGYLILHNARLDAAGHWVSSTDTYLEMGGIFETKERMEAKIRSDYGV